MPQARLPDINTAYIKYRNEIMAALKRKDYKMMHGSLNALNALLPPEYRVMVSSIEYEKLAKIDITYQCNSCSQEFEKEQVHVFELMPNALEGLIYSTTPEKVWVCEKCKTTNKLKQTTISQIKLQNPTYFGVVPDPPERKDGLMEKRKFELHTETWCLTYLGELEMKMAKFRDDHWMRGQDEDMDLGIDGGEESE